MSELVARRYGPYAPHANKQELAHCILKHNPGACFRDAAIEQRDRDLIDAQPVDFLDYAKGSFLRKIVSQPETDS
jgi:hypothetical protein